MCGGLGASFVVCWIGDFLCGMHKFGGSNNLKEDMKEKAFKIAKERANLVDKLITTCIENDKNN